MHITRTLGIFQSPAPTFLVGRCNMPQEAPHILCYYKTATTKNNSVPSTWELTTHGQTICLLTCFIKTITPSWDLRKTARPRDQPSYSVHYHNARPAGFAAEDAADMLRQEFLPASQLLHKQDSWVSHVKFSFHILPSSPLTTQNHCSCSATGKDRNRQGKHRCCPSFTADKGLCLSFPYF